MPRFILNFGVFFFFFNFVRDKLSRDLWTCCPKSMCISDGGLISVLLHLQTPAMCAAASKPLFPAGGNEALDVCVCATTKHTSLEPWRLVSVVAVATRANVICIVPPRKTSVKSVGAPPETWYFVPRCSGLCHVFIRCSQTVTSVGREAVRRSAQQTGLSGDKHFQQNTQKTTYRTFLSKERFR